MKTPQLPPFDHVPQPYRGPSAEEVLALRKQYLNPAIFTFYKQPIMVVEGKGPVSYTHLTLPTNREV